MATWLDIVALAAAAWVSDFSYVVTTRKKYYLSDTTRYKSNLFEITIRYDHKRKINAFKSLESLAITSEQNI